MSTTITRRHILKLAGGSALGFLFTPMPWKLLDDLSIWTQNWSLIPPLPRGPVSTVSTACTLCASGCPVEASIVNGVPFSLLGRSGGLCPFGLAGHHLMYHPSRLRAAAARITPAGSVQPVDADAMIAELAAGLKGPGGIAYVTARPDSMTADIAEHLLRDIPDAAVCTPVSWDGKFFDAARMILPEGHPPIGIEIGRVKTILSVSSPVLEGWGASHGLLDAMRDRRTSVKIIEASPVRSAAGVFGRSWLQIHPGSELACVLAITKLIIEEHVGNTGQWATQLKKTPLERLVMQTRLPEERIRETASILASGKPSFVIASDSADRSLHNAVWQLNALLGAFEPDGYVYLRRPLPASDPLHRQEFEDIPDGSLRMVLIDPSVTAAGLPPDILGQKMNGPDAVIVRLGAYADPLALVSTHVLRTALPYERLCETRAHAAAASSAFGLSVPLHQTSEPSATPAELLRSLVERAGLRRTAGIPANETDMLRKVTEQIHSKGRGELVTSSGERMPLAEVGSSDDLWESFMQGSRWTDRSASRGIAGKKRFLLDPRMLEVLEGKADATASSEEDHLIAIIEGLDTAAAFSAVSPALSKVYQESGLKPRATRVVVHPETARARGLSEHEEAVFVAGEKEIRARVAFRKDIPPGVAVFAAAPFGLPDEGRIDRPGLDQMAAQQHTHPRLITGDFQT